MQDSSVGDEDPKTLEVGDTGRSQAALMKRKRMKGQGRIEKSLRIIMDKFVTLKKLEKIGTCT